MSGWPTATVKHHHHRLQETIHQGFWFIGSLVHLCTKLDAVRFKNTPFILTRSLTPLHFFFFFLTKRTLFDVWAPISAWTNKPLGDDWTILVVRMKATRPITMQHQSIHRWRHLVSKQMLFCKALLSVHDNLWIFLLLGRPKIFSQKIISK